MDAKAAANKLIDLLEAADSPEIQADDTEAEWSRNWNGYTFSIMFKGERYTVAINDR